MRHDFSTIPDPETDLVTVPPGRYLCRVRDVHARRTKDGRFPQWALVLDVASGEHAGRLAAWDNLTFSERGLPRVKLTLRAFGFDVSGTLELEPDELRGRRAVVELVEGEWTNPVTQVTTRRLLVPFAGYAHPSTWEGEDDGLALDGEAAEPGQGGRGGGGPGSAAASHEERLF